MESQGWPLVWWSFSYFMTTAEDFRSYRGVIFRLLIEVFWLRWRLEWGI